MTRISILYPNNPNHRFDMDYYLATHIPLAVKRLSAQPGYKGVSVERGVAGGAPGSEPAYAVTCHFLFDSAESFMAAFTPIFQINEILLSR